VSTSSKNRVSRAQQVVDNARRRNAEQGNVQKLPAARLERGAADGKSTLTAIFPGKGGDKPERLDLSFLLDFPGITHLFAEGMLAWFKAMTHSSRVKSRDFLRGSWFAFLSESSLFKLLPEELGEQIINGFTTWLHLQRKSDGQPLHPNTTRKMLGALRCTLRAAPGGGHLLDLVPQGPRGARRRTEPTAVLQFAELVTVIAAAEKEVLALCDRWEVGQRLLAQGRDLLRQGAVLERSPGSRKEARSDRNLALVLAMLDQRYPSVIPDVEVITADNSLLGTTVQYALGAKGATSYFYASSRDLVPLALMLAVATVFNPDTILKLQWKNIDRNVDRLSNERRAVKFDVMEEDDVVEKVQKSTEPEASDASESPLAKVTGDKPRANCQLVRLLDPNASGPGLVSLNLVLDLLTKMTARIRAHVIDPDTYGDRLFIFVQRSKTKRPKGFGSSLDDASGDLWKPVLRKFIADNQLPDFTLKTIRATLLDYVQLFNRGDLEAARQVGNHGSRVTTWTHYTSDLVKRLLQEVTGETMVVRERWLESDGKLDPRKHREWTDKGCATPGWTCLDPFNSPRSNQKQGRLCKAFGECPDCPLSAARPDDPRSVMLYEALRRAIYRSVARMTAHVWQQRWAPVVAALDALLALVQPTVVEESRKFQIELPDVG